MEPSVQSIIRSEQPSGTGHTKTIQNFAALLLSIFQECGLGRVVAAINRHIHHDAYKVLAVLIPDSVQQLPSLFKFRLQFMVFHHKSYSFLSRTVRLTNSNPKALLLGCRGTLAQNRGTMGGTNTILIPQKP